MLEMRAICERCDADLPTTASNAFVCSFECTYCADCARGPLGGVCPNCGGALAPRPPRDAGFGESATTVLRRYADAWQAGDLDGVFASYADDFTIHYLGTSRFAGTHEGRDAAVGAMVEVSLLAPRVLKSVDEILVSDGGGVLVVTEELSRDGESATLQRVLRFRIADGRLRECWLHETDQATVDHLWR